MAGGHLELQGFSNENLVVYTENKDCESHSEDNVIEDVLASVFGSNIWRVLEALSV